MSTCTLVSNDWRQLSEAASKERDPQKLLELVERLNKVLQSHKEQRQGSVQPKPSDQ